MILILFIEEILVFHHMRKSSNPKWKTRFSEKGKVQKKLQTGHLSEGVNKILPFSLSNRDQSVSDGPSDTRISENSGWKFT